MSSRAVKLPRTKTHADQGSDLNVVYPTLADLLKLKRHLISAMDDRRMFMSVASGHEVEILQWVVLHVQVADIVRKTWAVVAPGQDPMDKHDKPHQLDLLLGLPWLGSRVHAHKGALKIGNKA